jgi:outer membrane protein OmpA-like peptidoglycan-associated protein
MKNPRSLPLCLSLVALAVLAGCSTVPPGNASLDEARSSYRAAETNSRTVELAPAELKVAGDALNRANDAWTRRDPAPQVDHLAYLARQRTAIAEATAARKSAEQTVASATTTRDQVRLEARTREADSATRTAQLSQRQSETSQRAAIESQRQSELAQRSAVDSQQRAMASQLQADVALQQASDAQARTSQVEAQLRELNAKQTDHGMVITIGDLLFDTNSARLKATGLRNVEKLGGFLQQYPQRNARVEGFTDSVGSDGANQDLSARRASAVRAALVEQGVAGTRITTRGYGEMYPTADNASADGRQLNRRVEIVLSDEAGRVQAR